MTPRKPIIYGPDGHPIVRARDRHAPKPRIGAGLEGWVSWGLIDRQGRVVKGGEQHNLFLDAGLEALTSSALVSESWFTHAAVGTSSVEPDATDTALGNELARSGTVLSALDGTTEVSNGVYELTRTWEFGYGVANGNLAELGIARASTGGLVVRELIRDVGGTPITITKTSDYLLRVTYTFTVSLTPTEFTPTSFEITGIGLISGNYMFIGETSGNSRTPDLRVFGQTAAAAAQGSSNSYYEVSASSTPMTGVYKQSISSTDLSHGSASFSPYVGGTYERSVSGMFGVSQANIPIATIGLSVRTAPAGAGQRLGFGFVIDPGDRFTKDSLHTLTIDDILSVSWGRA